MNYLIDTNILTRLAEPGHAMHSSALEAVKRLILQGNKLHIVPQNLYEFWVVCTRPISVNGMGKTVAEASAELAGIKSLFLLADDTPAILSAWERLVISASVTGKNAHDARLIAAMTVHGLSHLLTFNVKDFRCYSDLTVITPDEVIA